MKSPVSGELEEYLKAHPASECPTYDPIPVINNSHLIQSILWDLDLLPEQLTRGSVEWAKMSTIVNLIDKYDTAETLLRDIHAVSGLLRTDETRDLWQRLEAWVKDNKL